jgi:O-antigen/teichoic acid export membrane protein
MAGSDARPWPAVRRRLNRRARDSTALAAGSVVAGLLAYVFFALATRSLGAEGAAPVSILWSYWSAAAAVLTFTVQHWIIRTLAHDGHEGAVARSLPKFAIMAAGLTALAGVVAYAFRETLFGDLGIAFPALVAAITAGSLFMGLLRGALAGRHRYFATAASLMGENGLRVALAVGVALAGGGSKAFGVALASGPLVGLFWARSLRFARRPATAPASRNPLALVSGIAGGSLIAQIVITSPPVALAAAGGAPDEVTSLFVALAVWRAPYIVALGVSPKLTGGLTRLVVNGQIRQLARLRALIVVGVIGGAGAAALFGFTLLQPLLHLAFGEDVHMDDWALAAVGVGTAIALGNLVLLLLILALGRSGAATVAWVAAVAVTGAWLGISGLSPTSRIVVAFVIAEAAAFVMLLGFSMRMPGKPRGTRPGESGSRAHARDATPPPHTGQANGSPAGWSA